MRAINWLTSVAVLLLHLVFLSTPMAVQGQDASGSAGPTATAAEKAQKLYEAAQHAYDSGDYAEGIENYRQALLANRRDRPRKFDNSLAWCWATCPDEKQLDGRLAAKIGSYLCEETNYEDPFYLDTYAAGLAEAGNFDDAIKWQQKAVDTAPGSKTFPKSELEPSRLRLALYKNHIAYREVPHDAIVARFNKIAGKPFSLKSLFALTEDDKSKLIDYLVTIPELHYMGADSTIVKQHYDLFLLMLLSPSLDFQERKEWTQKITDTTTDAEIINYSIAKLTLILIDERKQIEAGHNRSPQTVAMSTRQRPSSAVKTEDQPSEAESKPQEQIVFKPEIKIEPKINLSQSPPKKAVDIIIHSVTVYGTKDNGDPWDKSGPPDPKVCIRNLDTGDTFTTPTKRDTESAEYHCKSIRVAEGQKFEVTVWDADVLFDDKIGSYTKEVTAETMKQGKVDWSFDRVSSLVLEFQP